MRKKLYISPEFEWLDIDLIEDVLSASNPDIEVDPDNTIPEETDDGGGEYGHDTEPTTLDPGSLVNPD